MRPNQIVSDEQVLEALKETGNNISETARKLGIKRSSVQARRKTLTKRGLWDDRFDHVVPDGYQVKGKSQYFDKDGKIAGVWVKSDLDKERQVELMREVVNSFLAEMPKAKKVKAPKQIESDLMNCYILTDYHLGMMAWGEETGGADWDLNKGIDLLKAWIDEAVKRAPQADVAILAQLGDFLHWDGIDAVTPKSKHILDADTRFSKVVRTAIMLLRHCITKLLTKYKKVSVIFSGGNHDPASTIWLRELFKVFYELDERVEVDMSPELFYCFEHGEASVFFNHGDKRNLKGLAETYVTRFRDVYGRTKYSYAHSGHKHVDALEEHNGIRLEQHRTLAPQDAYAATNGYPSGRDSKVISYHRKFGEVGRVTISPEMLK